MRLLTPLLLLLAGLVATPAVAAPRTPVLLELFGSEGCSSCPPADDLLHELLSQQPFLGVRLLVLAEHVDYWDSLGWKDPFASSAYTARQQALVKNLHIEGGLYTPMLVVDGAQACVGSDRPAAMAAIKAAALKPHATLSLTFIGPFLQKEGARVAVTLRNVPPGWGNRLAVLEGTCVRPEVTSHVTRGENAGKSLKHVDVAIATTRTIVDLRKLGTSTVIGPIALPPGGAPVVVVLRAMDGTQVLGSAMASWPPHEGAAPTEF
jgi:hypothetical protein